MNYKPHFLLSRYFSLSLSPCLLILATIMWSIFMTFNLTTWGHPVYLTILQISQAIQTWFFSCGLATSQGEGKLWIHTSFTPPENWPCVTSYLSIYLSIYLSPSSISRPYYMISIHSTQPANMRITCLPYNPADDPCSAPGEADNISRSYIIHACIQWHWHSCYLVI